VSERRVGKTGGGEDLAQSGLFSCLGERGEPWEARVILSVSVMVAAEVE
jgi:hypothetical protein